MTLWRYRDVLIAAVLGTVALWEALVSPLTQPGYVGNPVVDAAASVIIVASTLVRRAHPVGFAIAVTLGTTLLWVGSRGESDLPFIGYSSYMLASYTLGAQLVRREALLAGLLTFAAWGVVDVIDARDGLPSVHQDYGFYVLVGLALAAGAGMRHLREQSSALRQALVELAQERATAEAAAALEERHRIARDMHDVLTHTVSAVAVQAGALRLRLPVGTESEAVEALESASREALLELRQLLGVLRDDDRQLGPAPGLEDLEHLTAPLAATGIDVTVERRVPTAEVPPGTALAVYRLVQESLTNIGKHGSARHVAIDIARSGSCLSITVTNDGPATRPWLPGHGITGMRERVMAYGGELEVGPLPEGDGWRVHGMLPL